MECNHTLKPNCSLKIIFNYAFCFENVLKRCILIQSINPFVLKSVQNIQYFLKSIVL